MGSVIAAGITFTSSSICMYIYIHNVIFCESDVDVLLLLWLGATVFGIPAYRYNFWAQGEIKGKKLYSKYAIMFLYL